MSEDKQEMEKRGSSGAWVMLAAKRSRGRGKEGERERRRLVNVG